ncbi:MAG: FtsQ-type POTRA domain-containing protein [Methylococcaceae bacterium]|nr:MAG: FtsQ-type POTRA domain-containing protein [Methylococcaceae bacterium]
MQPMPWRSGFMHHEGHEDHEEKQDEGLGWKQPHNCANRCRVRCVYRSASSKVRTAYPTIVEVTGRPPAGGTQQSGSKRGGFMLTLLALLLLAAAGIAIKFMPVRHVRVEGALRQVEPPALQAVLEPLLQGSYLLVDLKAMEAAVLGLPWVGEASVKRYWPDTLVVKIQEQTPYARSGDGSFVSEKGVRFRAGITAETANLPAIIGPVDYEKPMLAMLKTMNARLGPLGRRIAVLHLSNRHAWTVKLEDGLVVVMGRQDALAAFERFLTLAGLLGAERLQAVQRVDLRYPNGFAVSMKAKAAQRTN